MQVKTNLGNNSTKGVRAEERASWKRELLFVQGLCLPCELSLVTGV